MPAIRRSNLGKRTRNARSQRKTRASQTDEQRETRKKIERNRWNRNQRHRNVVLNSYLAPNSCKVEIENSSQQTVAIKPMNTVEESNPYDRIECFDPSLKSSEVETLEITPDINLHLYNEDCKFDIPDSTGPDTKEESLPYVHDSFVVNSEPSYPDYEQTHVEDFSYSNNGKSNSSNTSNQDRNEESLTSILYDTIVVKPEPVDPDSEEFHKTCIEDSTYSNDNENKEIYLSPAIVKQPVTRCSSQAMQEVYDIKIETHDNQNASNSLHIAYMRMSAEGAEHSHLYQQCHQEGINQRKREEMQWQQNSLPIDTVSIVPNTDKIETFTEAALNNQLYSIPIPHQCNETNKEEINNIKKPKRTYAKKGEPSKAASPAERSRKYRERKKEELRRRRMEKSLLQIQNGQSKRMYARKGEQSTAASPAERSRKYRERKKEEIKKRRMEKRLLQQNNAGSTSEVNKAFHTKTRDGKKDCNEPLVSLLGHPVASVLQENIVDIVKQSDLESITMNGIIQKIFNMYPKFDLSYRKEFIKQTLRFILYKLGEDNSHTNKEVEGDTDSPDCCLTTTDNSESISESVMKFS